MRPKPKGGVQAFLTAKLGRSKQTDVEFEIAYKAMLPSEDVISFGELLEIIDTIRSDFHADEGYRYGLTKDFADYCHKVIMYWRGFGKVHNIKYTIDW